MYIDLVLLFIVLYLCFSDLYNLMELEKLKRKHEKLVEHLITTTDYFDHLNDEEIEDLI